MYHIQSKLIDALVDDSRHSLVGWWSIFSTLPNSAVYVADYDHENGAPVVADEEEFATPEAKMKRTPVSGKKTSGKSPRRNTPRSCRSTPVRGSVNASKENDLPEMEKAMAVIKGATGKTGELSNIRKCIFIICRKLYFLWMISSIRKDLALETVFFTIGYLH